MATTTDLVNAVSKLRTAGAPDRPTRHQAVVLLWAIGRARRRLPRLTQWSAAEIELRNLLTEYGLPENRPTPEYPFVALNGSPLWELRGNTTDAPPAHGGTVRRWLSQDDPSGGLPSLVYEQLATDDAARGIVVGAIVERFFPNQPVRGMLVATGVNMANTNLDVDWDLSIGDVLRRRELHDQYGGQQQGGIATPRDARHVFLFTERTGQQYGYGHDGWQDDGSFDYTGQGTTGDQVMKATNRAIIDPRRRLHVFQEVGRGIFSYLGEFQPDPDEPVRSVREVDKEGTPRGLLIFRLWPLINNGPHPGWSVPEPMTSTRLAPVETRHVTDFTSAPSAQPIIAHRPEAALVHRYCDWLMARGRTSNRHEITLPGESGPLYTDLFDVSRQELVEAKGSTAREYVRYALGQLLGYRRHVEHQHLAVLLPGRPSNDLVDLLLSNGVHCIFETKDRFDREDAT